MQINLFVLAFLAYTVNIFAQYPFEKYKSPEVIKFNNWIDSSDTEEMASQFIQINLSGVYKNSDGCQLKVSPYLNNVDNKLSYTQIQIFRNNHQIQEFHSDKIDFVGSHLTPYSVKVGDFNGDGFKDIKIYGWYGGNGLASLYNRVIYLFQKRNGSFTKVSFLDMGEREERDFNKEGKYEVITMKVININNHNFWFFQLYQWEGDTLVTVSKKYSYPILIQLLYKPNYIVYNKISKIQNEKYLDLQPDEYIMDEGKIMP